jgi:hypothetical protein
MRKGDIGMDVRNLQKQLNAAGFATVQDGWYGSETEAAVRAFQASVGLVTDGLAGPKTLAALRAGRAGDRLLRQADIEAAAVRLGVSAAAIMAVNEVESHGAGFLPDGRPVILFERHVMHRLLDEAGFDTATLALQHPTIVSTSRGGYAGGAFEYSRLALGLAIDRACAVQATSWGQYQIMGYHWQACGFSDHDAFVAAMGESEAMQLAAFVRFIESDEALFKALKSRKWVEFARLYNGPAYKENLYDIRLARAYERHAAALATAPTGPAEPAEAAA